MEAREEGAKPMQEDLEASLAEGRLLLAHLPASSPLAKVMALMVQVLEGFRSEDRDQLRGITREEVLEMVMRQRRMVDAVLRETLEVQPDPGVRH
jgi:hypothetical protein